MSLVAWIAVVAGGALYLVLWRAAFAQWYDDFKDDWGWGTLILGLAMSFIAAPIVGSGRLMFNAERNQSDAARRRALRVGAVLAGEAKEQTQADRIAELERENARLERELEIGGDRW
jgi:hypothetical protein